MYISMVSALHMAPIFLDPFLKAEAGVLAALAGAGAEVGAGAGSDAGAAAGAGFDGDDDAGAGVDGAGSEVVLVALTSALAFFSVGPTLTKTVSLLPPGTLAVSFSPDVLGSRMARFLLLLKSRLTDSVLEGSPSHVAE